MKKLVLACLTFLCVGNAFAQLNMTLTDQIDYTQDLSSLWGYIDPTTGKEYAAVGTETGTAIVDLSDPFNIVEIAFMNDLTSTWREVKAYGHYVYAVTEAGGGVQVIDMHDIDNITQTHWAPNIPGLGTLSSIHSITVDEFGYLYLNGSNLNAGGSLIVDASADNGTLTYVGKLPAIYCHDSYARDNKFYSSDIYAGNFKVYDVTDRTNPVLLAAQQTPYSFTHNTWLSDDSKTIFTTDERANAPVGVYDITDLNNIKELDQFRPVATLGQGVIPHNVHVWNDWVITAYYTDGTLVLDGSRPDNMIEVGYFDSFVSQSAGFFGVWGVYPYFPSGLVIASDIENGLLVYQVNYVRACWLEGKVTDAVTGLPVQGANVHIASPQANAASSGIDGVYKTGQALAGTFDVTYSATGYQSKLVSASLENGVLTLIDVELEPLSSYVFSGQIIKSSDGSPIAGAKVLMTDGVNEFSASTDANGNFSFPGIFGGVYQMYAGAWGYKTKQLTNVVVGSSGGPVVVSLSKGYYDDFILDFGWAATATASTGKWERGEPIGTVFSQGNAQSNPDFDLTDDFGDKCYVTGNGGGDAPTDDVDNGVATMTSPVIDLSTYNQPLLKYTPWFFNAGGTGTPNDNILVKVSNGTTTVTVETISQSASNWKAEREIEIGSLIALTNNMRVIFEAGDYTPGHLVEAAVDGFEIEDVSAYPFFQASATTGCAPMTVNFTDASDSTSVWNWSFPGGTPSTSNQQNPTVVYSGTGVYDVTLSVTTASGNQYVVERPGFITVNASPSADFSYSVIGNVANFTNLASSPNATYTWNFGDNSTSTQANPAHTYNSAGNYTVTLTASNNCGTVTATQIVNVTVVPPTAVFQTSATDGCAPFTVNFTNASLGNPTSYNWSFPGGTPSVSTDENPSVTYASGGTYSAQLTVGNAAGSNTATMNQLIHVGSAPFVSFTYDVNGLSVGFVNASTNASSYEWHFGDGTTSTQASPTHTYTAPGQYEITLNATNDCGLSVVTQTINLGVDGVENLEEASYHMVANPNPFSHELVVNYSLKNSFKDANLLVLNAAGQQVSIIKLQAAEGNISLGNELSNAGVYFLRLNMDGKIGKALRVVKQ
ncbi:MAG: choice-of-anchor B family protein [Saprospiraceae bacterium]|nr:choice-of-anchor B family protein [Saprospiraceae bacterium]